MQFPFGILPDLETKFYLVFGANTCTQLLLLMNTRLYVCFNITGLTRCIQLPLVLLKSNAQLNQYETSWSRRLRSVHVNGKVLVS